MTLFEFFQKLGRIECKIEYLRQKLAENTEFEPYATFKVLSKRNVIEKKSLYQFLYENNVNYNESEIQNTFIQNHGFASEEEVNYEEFLTFILPKNDDILRAEVIEREVKRYGGQLPHSIEQNIVKLIDLEIQGLQDLEENKIKLAEQFDLLEIWHDIEYRDKISFQDLYDFCIKNEFYPYENEISYILMRVDKNDDGFISKQEFFHCLKPIISKENTTQYTSQENTDAKFKLGTTNSKLNYSYNLSNLQKQQEEKQEDVNEFEDKQTEQKQDPPQEKEEEGKELVNSFITPARQDDSKNEQKEQVVQNFNQENQELKQENEEKNELKQENEEKNELKQDEDINEQYLRSIVAEKETIFELTPACEQIDTKKTEETEQKNENQVNEQEQAQETNKIEKQQSDQKDSTDKKYEEISRKYQKKDVYSMTFQQSSPIKSTRKLYQTSPNRSNSKSSSLRTRKPFDQNFELMQRLKQVIVLDKKIETVKEKLAMRQDFNLLDFFSLFDGQQKGYANIRDIERQFDYLRVSYTISEMNNFLKKVDYRHHGRIDFEKFAESFAPNRSEYNSIMRERRPMMHKPARFLIEDLFELETIKLIRQSFQLQIENERVIKELYQELKFDLNLNIYDIFRILDRDNDGYISIYDLRDNFDVCDLYVNENDLQLLFYRLDKNRSQDIGLNEIKLEF